MSDTVEKTSNGAIVYDPGIINQISDAAFTKEGWQTAKQVEGKLRAAGRGDTLIVSNGEQEFVLRHYCRGGLPGRFIRDTYLWLGEDATRSFNEWYLLAKLYKMGLPVPRPAAARYVRRGPFYSADLITQRIPGIQSLAERISGVEGGVNFWRKLGAQIHRFHKAGVYHADLNAYNVQLGLADKLFLLDFDRGKLQDPGHWQQKNVSRLHRSLKKIKELDKNIQFTNANWSEFLDGYFTASRSA